MQGRTRRTAAVGAAAFVLAGTAAFAASSGTASAATTTAQCGQTVTAKPGDTINTPFGPQTVADGVTSLVGGLLGNACKITVNVVDTVVAPLPVAGQAAAGAVNNTVSGTTNSVTGTVSSTGKALTGRPQTPPPAQTAPGGGTAPQPGGAPISGGTPTTGGNPVVPAGDSPVLTGDSAPFALLPFGSSGYSPTLDYRGIPYALAALWAPGPGIQYDGDIAGFAPESGTLSTGQQSARSVQNAGRAEALPGTSGPAGMPLGLPTLAAVLALSGVTAALVRSWVLRGTR